MTGKLFGTSGIRGSIAEKVTTDLALNLGRALGTFLDGKGTVGIGTDARTSREMLRNGIIAGVLSTGTDVIDLGLAPMPTIAYYSQIDGISASVIVTASHNPPKDNGFKFSPQPSQFAARYLFSEIQFSKKISSVLMNSLPPVKNLNPLSAGGL